MENPIVEEYGLIGNDYSCAIINRIGSVQWCCLPFIDSPSHFAALFDAKNGGLFQILPEGEFRSQQRYFPGTLILETVFETPTGRGKLTDWMPMQEELSVGPILCRQITPLEGKIPWSLTCTPRFRNGFEVAQVEKHPDGILFRSASLEELALLRIPPPFEVSTHKASGIVHFTLDENQRPIEIYWLWGRQGILSYSRPALQLETTLRYWHKVRHRCLPKGCVFGGPWHDTVTRSGLILKLLTTRYTGSLVESVAVSVPSTNFDKKTWGLRYALIRDGTFLLQALVHLGYAADAKKYTNWIKSILERDGTEGLQPYYTLDGGKHFTESENPYPNHHGRPSQFQLDIYGHVVLTVVTSFQIFGEMSESLWQKLSEIAEYICQAWRRPDYGPWGDISRPEHFLISKLFCWVTLDRMTWLSEKLGKPTPSRWQEERMILFRTILDQGYDRSRNCFVRAFGAQEIDTSALWIPLLNFLPVDDPRVQGSINLIQAQFSEGVLLRKPPSYPEHLTSGGVDFTQSLLSILCLCLMGRAEEASDRLAEICTYANRLGIFSDPLQPLTQTTPAHFPSTTAHLILINSALYVSWAKGRFEPSTPLLGTQSKSIPIRKAA